MKLPQNSDDEKTEVCAVSTRESTWRFQCKLVINSWQVFQQLHTTIIADAFHFHVCYDKQ